MACCNQAILVANMPLRLRTFWKTNNKAIGNPYNIQNALLFVTAQ